MGMTVKTLNIPTNPGQAIKVKNRAHSGTLPSCCWTSLQIKRLINVPSTEMSWMAKRRMMVQIIPRVILIFPSTISAQQLKMKHLIVFTCAWSLDNQKMTLSMNVMENCFCYEHVWDDTNEPHSRTTETFDLKSRVTSKWPQAWNRGKWNRCTFKCMSGIIHLGVCDKCWYGYLQLQWRQVWPPCWQWSLRLCWHCWSCEPSFCLAQV